MKGIFAEMGLKNKRTSTGGAKPQLLTNWTEAEKISTRKELAKISGTSEGNIARFEYVEKYAFKLYKTIC